MNISLKMLNIYLYQDWSVLFNGSCFFVLCIKDVFGLIKIEQHQPWDYLFVNEYQINYNTHFRNTGDYVLGLDRETDVLKWS